MTQARIRDLHIGLGVYPRLDRSLFPTPSSRGGQRLLGLALPPEICGQPILVLGPGVQTEDILIPVPAFLPLLLLRG